MCQLVEEVVNVNASLYRHLNDNTGMNNQMTGARPEMDANKVRWLNKISDKVKLEAATKDLGWREELKEGDYIDALSTFSTPSNNQGVKGITGWQPAKIA
jgi:hypothetical protein